MGNSEPNDAAPIEAPIEGTAVFPVYGAADHDQPDDPLYGPQGYRPHEYGQQEYGQQEYGQQGDWRQDCGQQGDWRQEYGQASNRQDSYGQDAYAQDSYGQAAYGQDVYAQPGYPQEEYAQPGYPQPGYAQAGYGYTGYGAYTDQGYGETGYENHADPQQESLRPPDPWDDPQPGYVQGRDRSRARADRPSAARLTAALRASAPWAGHSGIPTESWPAPPRRTPRTSPWLLAAGAVAAVGAVVAIFALGGSGTPAPAALSSAAAKAGTNSGGMTGGATGGGMAGGMAATGYRLIVPASADGMPEDTVFARDLASGRSGMDNRVKHMYSCLGRKLHAAGEGQVTSDVIARYETGAASATSTPEGFFFAGYNGTFKPGATLYLLGATGCGFTAPGNTGALRLPPGPHGGTLYTVGGSQGTECVWSTATTAGMVTFSAGDGGLTVPDPATACVNVRDAVEERAGM
jgi:hypothetical protein